MKSAHERSADRLWEAWRTGTACAPIRDLISGDDIDGAYEVQRLNVDRQLALGDEIVGYKIGLTSTAVQVQLGVDQPDFGPLFASRRVEPGGVVDLARSIAPRVEAEIAFVLGQPVEATDIDEQGLAASVDHVAASLEIVDSRVRDWNIRIADTVADFASGSMFVLGEQRQPIDAFDLAAVPMSLTIDGQEVSSGSGAATMGSPLTAAAWLARTLARLRTPLGAGDIVLTGALGPFADMAPGQHIHADLGELGSVGCTTTSGADT